MQLEAERNRRESDIYAHLLTSNDPEIQARAATGMIDSAMGPQRKGGIRGWLGDLEQSPVLGQIRALISTPTGPGTPAALPSRSITGTSTATPGTAGQVSTQTTRAGQPPPAATAPDQTPTTAALAPGVGQPPPTGPAPMDLQIGPLSTPQAGPPTYRQVFPRPGEAEASAERTQLLSRADTVSNYILQHGGSPLEARQAAERVMGGLSLQTPTLQQGGEVLWEEATPAERAQLTASGTPGQPGQRFRREISRDGQAILYPIAAPKPTGPEAQTIERAKQIQADAAAKGQPISDADAQQQARIEARTQTQQLTEARIGAYRDRAIAAYQARTGTRPATLTQAIQAVGSLLGSDPTVTAADKDEAVKAVMAASRSGGTGGVSPRIGTSPRTAVPAPSATTPTSADAKGYIGLSPNLAGKLPHYKQYSAQGRQTIQALATMEPMLTKLEAAIRSSGEADSNNALGENWNKWLMEKGVDPGQLEEQRLQLAGVADAYGLRGLLGGRTNQTLQGIFNLHLVQAGDSPKLLLDKITTLKQFFPVARQAVDTAETAHIGGGGGGTPAGGGKITVTAPDGSIHPFDTRAEADAFKQLIATAGRGGRGGG